MKITASITYYDGGKIVEHAQAMAEFDGEYELPGCVESEAKAIAGRAMEIQAMTQGLLAGIRADFLGGDNDGTTIS